MRLSAIILLLAVSTADAEFKQSLRGLGRGPAKKSGGNTKAYSGIKSTSAGERKPKMYTFNINPSTSAAPEADEALNAAPGVAGDVNVPNMETAPESGIMQASFGGSSIGTGDIADIPNADDSSLQQGDGLSLAPGGGTVEIPEMEPIPPEIAQASSAGWVKPAGTLDMVDIPNDDTGSPPFMTTVHSSSVNAAAARDSVQEDTASEPEVSVTEGMSESSAAKQAPVDTIPTDTSSSTLSTSNSMTSNEGNDGGNSGELVMDGPEMLAPEYSSEGETAGPEIHPLFPQFAVEAEAYVLGNPTSVCAVTEEHAVEMCSQLPICKFKKHGDTISTQIVSGQGDCVRRCDSPMLDAGHCSPHEQCFHFVFGCECPKLSADGGKCQPF